MKICIVTDAYYPYPSGVSEYSYYVAKYLRRFGHEVKILTTNYPNERGVSNEEIEKDVKRVGRVFFLPANKSYATPTIGFGVQRIVKGFIDKENFDFLHLHTPLLPPGIAFYALRHSNSVNAAVFHATSFKLWKRGTGIYKKFFEKYRKKLHALVAISPSARDSVIRYLPGDYKIIPCGVDTEKFNPQVKPRKEFSSSSPKILYFGRLDRRKGLPELLKSMPLIKKEITNVQLIVAGRGDLEKRCKKLAKKLDVFDSVIFKGFIPEEDVPSYYASCDVYCSPALGGESFGIVLVEAMAVGKPVAASKIIGYDYVIKDGHNGLFFDPEDPKSIAKTLIRILKDKELRKELAENGKNFVKDYSWEKVVRDLETFYLQVFKQAKKIQND
jgi:phosphatidylinositol alpha-mannosyltransferase